MINVIWHKDSLILKGHANSNKIGNDLVCCAASAIVQTATAWFNKNDIKIIKNEKTPLFEIKLIKTNELNKGYLKLIYQQLTCLAKHNEKYMSCKKQ